MDINLVIPVLTFLIIAFAAESISKFFTKIHLPIISGLIITGIIVGPYFLKIIPKESIKDLHFLFDISLAFIAYAAGTELYLKELKDDIKSIYLNTLGQFLVTFLVGSVVVYFLADTIPFMKNMSFNTKLAVSILSGTIFVARSPSSAIAIISELRAKGPFVRTVMGVTVIKDVLVVILFSVILSLSINLIRGEDFNYLVFIDILIELLLAVLFGFLLGLLLKWTLSIRIPQLLKGLLLLAYGFVFYLFSHQLEFLSSEYLPFVLHIEPLLVCILAGFYITNYTGYRLELQKIVHDIGPPIYVIFFTLTGATMSIDVLKDIWFIAFLLFGVRILAMIVGGWIGGKLANDPPLFTKVNWMPYVTQAGVGVGLATIVSLEFPEWGIQFYTIILGVIVLNQIIGPPLFKYAIIKVGEAHRKAPEHIFDGVKDLLVFGYENQSVSLAKNLQKKGWNVKIATFLKQGEFRQHDALDVVPIDNIDLEVLKNLKTDKIEAALLLLDDEKNLKIAELLYEHFGTREVIVRITDRNKYNKFKELNCYVIDPSKAMINLMMQYIKSPHTATLLLGELKGQSSADIELRDTNIVGKYLRELQLPSDVLILSIKRKDQIIITHGFTKLELGDIMTVVGSEKSLEEVELKFSVV